MTKDDQRAAVLRAHYDVNENDPGGFEQTSAIATRTGLDLNVVVQAQQYLVDKGLLFSGPKQQIRALDGFFAMMARITDRGVDFVEHPRDFANADIPGALINIIAQGDVTGVNVAARDQQIITGNVSGPVAQGGASVSEPFPIGTLAELLRGDQESLEIAKQIDAEVAEPKPRWGTVFALLEAFNGAVTVKEAVSHVLLWFQQPGVPDHVQATASALLA